MNDDLQWFRTLELEGDPEEDQIEVYVATADAISTLVENAQYDNTAHEPVQVDPDLLEELSKTILQVKELKSELQLVVQNLIQQARESLPGDMV